MSGASGTAVTRVLKITGGFACLLVGIIMLVTPGPGWVVIAVGLGMLGPEFAWARRLLGYIKSISVRLRNAIFPRGGGKRPHPLEKRPADFADAPHSEIQVSR